MKNNVLYPAWEIDVFQKAWHFATQKHAGQTYGGAEPDERIDYLNHIGSVFSEIIFMLKNTNQSYDENCIIQCALLHDTLEDTPTTYQELSSQFGEKVADGVQALTKNMLLQPKKNAMLDSLQRIILQGPEIQCVKVADRICNLQKPPFYWDANKKKSYLQEAILIYQTLENADELLRIRLNQKIENYVNYF